MSPERVKNQKQKQRKKIFRKWHRRIGFSASLFLFNLAITGILLNHYEALNLHKKFIHNGLLLDWYGVKAPKNINCEKIGTEDKGSNQVCQIDTLTYLIKSRNEMAELVTEGSPVISLVKNTSEIYLLTAKSLTIYNHQFELIDRLILSDFEVFRDPADKIKAALIIDQQLLIKTQNQLLFLDQMTFEFQTYQTNSPIAFRLAQQFSQLDPIKEPALFQSLQTQYRQKQITLLKFVQDLHSGQILMSSGKLLTDLTGLIIMLLAITGFITWQRRKNNP